MGSGETIRELPADRQASSRGLLRHRQQDPGVSVGQVQGDGAGLRGGALGSAHSRSGVMRLTAGGYWPSSSACET